MGLLWFYVLVSHQERLFEPRFIHDSYACRKGKGTLAASDRLMTFLRQITANGRRPAWALKLDVASFFPSIHKATLDELLMPLPMRPELRWLTRTLLFHDPTTNYHFRSRVQGALGPDRPAYPVPPHKSLFGKHNQRGLPIGNLTSQFWGNVYLNPLDHFIKRTLKCQYYLRYVDDMILLAPEREMLDTWRHAIETFLWDRLQLTLRPEMIAPFAVRRGIDFVGWKTWWNRRLPRRRTLGDLQTRLDTFERMAVRTMWGGRAQHISLQAATAARVDELYTVLASYTGHLRHGATHQFWSQLWARYAWLEALYSRQRWRLTPRWSKRPLMRRIRLQSAYGHLLRQAGNNCLVFFPCGRFIEFYGPQRLRAAATLGLRTVALPRAHFALTAGFPWWLSGAYLSRAVRDGFCVVQVRQYPSLLSPHALIRLPYGIWLPVTGPSHYYDEKERH